MKDSDQHKKDISKLHKEKLGMDIPDNFFAKSKKNILNKIIQEEQPRQTIFWLRPIIAYPIAASIVLAITLTLWMQNKDTVNTEQITNTKTIKTINPDILNGSRKRRITAGSGTDIQDLNRLLKQHKQMQKMMKFMMYF